MWAVHAPARTSCSTVSNTTAGHLPSHTDIVITPVVGTKHWALKLNRPPEISHYTPSSPVEPSAPLVISPGLRPLSSTKLFSGGRSNYYTWVCLARKWVCCHFLVKHFLSYLDVCVLPVSSLLRKACHGKSLLILIPLLPCLSQTHLYQWDFSTVGKHPTVPSLWVFV